MQLAESVELPDSKLHKKLKKDEEQIDALWKQASDKARRSFDTKEVFARALYEFLDTYENFGLYSGRIQ